MSLYERVPQIDLSPEFSDPPYAPFAVRDYLRLLGDLLYFPQAARDYVRNYARSVRSESRPPEQRSPAAWGAWLRDNPVQTNFLWMVGVLGVALILAAINGAGLLAALLAGASVPLGAMGWAMLLALVSLFVMLLVGALGDEAGALAPFALPAALAIGLTWLACAAAPSLGVREGFAGMALLAFGAALAFGMAAAALFATASVGANGIWTHAALATVVSVLLAVAIGFFGWPSPEKTEMAAPLLGDLVGLAVLAALGYLLGALRVDDYLLHARYPGANPTLEDWLAIARVTPLPLPHLHDHMTAWLDFEWQQGMDNCVSLWWFTGQQAGVRGAMHEVLRGDHPAPTQPDPGVKLDAAAGMLAARSLAMVARIADTPQRYPWGMITWERPDVREMWAALLGRNQHTAFAAASPAVQRRLKRQRLRQGAAQRGPVRPLPMERPEEALVAGFWYLERGYLADALAALRKIPAGPQAAEMVSLVQALHDLGSQENLLANPQLELPKRPLIPFRPAAWQALETTQEVVRFANLARQAVTPSRRTLATEHAAALLDVLAAPSQPTTAETRYVQQLAALWEADLAAWLDNAPPPEPLGPVDNPFLYAEPLRSSRMFVGHSRELAALRQAWQSGNLQPLLLHGDPLIGKTSLLYAAERATPSVELAWFHLGHTDRKRMALPQVLAAVEEAVRQTSMLEVAAYAPGRSMPATAVPPAADIFGETERVIRRSCTLLQPRNLVLVLDDFDGAAALLDGDGALPAFIDFVAHLFQTISNFTVVFVHAQPPASAYKQMAGSFADMVRMLAVAPLGAEDVGRLVRPPGFPLYFADDAVACMNEATAGHPYLVQLLGHAVVERFNRRAATRQGDPLLLAEDVEAVLDEREFVRRVALLFRRLDEVTRQRIGNSGDASGDGVAQGRLWLEWENEQAAQRAAAAPALTA